MSILTLLEDKDIVSFYLCDDKEHVEVREECDGYYKCQLTATQLDELIIELHFIRAKMIKPISDIELYRFGDESTEGKL